MVIMSLTAKQKYRVVDAAINLYSQAFAHRAMKERLYGVDTEALFHNLKLRCAELKDDEFHSAMRRIFTGIRDRHTKYYYSKADVYSLPFTVERAFVNDGPRFFITKTKSSDFAKGVEVTHWNGTPVQAVIAKLSEEVGSGNHASRFSLATYYLTYRPTSVFIKPPEDWVIITLLDEKGNRQEKSLKWQLENADIGLQGRKINLAEVGVDEDLLQLNWHLFSTFSSKFIKEPKLKYSNVETSRIRIGDKDYAYLRIFHFDVEDADDFAQHVAGELKGLPQDGVVIDIRGNPGGYIKAGESLLQLLSSTKITPHGFRFRASDAISYLVNHSTRYAGWRPTVNQGLQIASEFSVDLPIEGMEQDYNKIGRVYLGPSILLVDAMTFSTGDLFTSGYQYHGIGKIICTDENIAAGGANNWRYDVLRAGYPGFLMALENERELSKNVVGDGVRASFMAAGIVLGGSPIVSPIEGNRLGPAWEIKDSDESYRIVRMDWLRSDLGVYFEGDNPFFHDLPPEVDFGFSIRQAVRKLDHNGFVLEDQGILADHYYKMTKRDLLEKNIDLIHYAVDLLGSHR
jgi:hypothetical protein